MNQQEQLDRITEQLDEISKRSILVLYSYLQDNKDKGFYTFELKTNSIIEEVIYSKLQGYPDTEEIGPVTDDIDDFFQQQGETTYSIFTDCYVEIVEELLDIGINIEIESIFSFFAFCRSKIVSQRIQEAYKNQNDFNDTLIHTWAETCGLLEALNVAEKICLTKHMAYKKKKNAPEGTIEPYKNFKKKA